jgi:1-phosphatidylinositol-4-phosphate 5-kinase
MIPNNDDGDEKQVVRDGHSSAPGGLEKVNSGFDYRLNDDKNGVHDSLNGALDHESEGKHRHGIGGVGFEMGYLPPDQRPGLPTELLTQLQLADPEIDDDTEAAEALRANATVKVGKVGKVARSVGAQSVRKVAKRLTLRGQSGNRRGKPPRIPPGMTISPMEAADAAILVVAEASKEDDDSVESALSGPHNQEIPAMSAEMHMPERHDADGSKFRAHTAQAHLDIKDIPLEVTAATMEAGRKLMGAIDPHNLLQLQRWRRKNKKGKKNKRKSYVKGKVIDGRHELYALSLAVMLGVRTSIARTNTILASSDRKKLLSPQDFMAEEKYEFSPKGSATTPPHKLSHTFKFKDYAPVAFAYLRRMFGVNEFDFLLSVCGNANFIEFISNAKSGQFFFYSSDGKYMIKTMTNAESKFLRRSE